MQRERKFRGKQITTGEWVYGGFFIDRFNKEAIIEFSKEIVHTVEPNTVGEYTGRKDKNDKEIYEGDITKDYQGNLFECAWSEFGHWELNPIGRGIKIGFYQDSMVSAVIGNIYENPELIVSHNGNTKKEKT